MALRLHCFGESGNAWKCALAMELAGLPWEAAFVDFFNGGARRPEFLALNPMGEVPVLEDGGEVLTQSGVILMHLARKAGRFGGATPAEEREILRWILWDNHKFSAQIGTLRFLGSFLPAARRPEGVIPWLEGRVRAACKVLDTHLAGQDWVAGGAGPTIADISCCSYLYYPEPHGRSRGDWPRIDAWLDRIAALPGWKHPYDLMPRAFGATA